jgi:hypothetical protein
MLPKTPEQWVGHQAGQQIVADSGDGVVAAQPLVQGFSGFHVLAPQDITRTHFIPV